MNPCAAVNDLLPFQGSPFGQLGYFSNWQIYNGEGGIRTHAPLRTNGFQDRLVMTTSIPLHILYSLLLLSATQELLYQIISILSTTFLFIFHLVCCSELFTSATCFILSRIKAVVNTFFYFFYIFLQKGII